jgi:hypothetical protein
MLFFSTTAAPRKFRRLHCDLAGKFIRTFFPHCYLNHALVAKQLPGALEFLALVVLATLASRFVLA